MSDHEHDQTDLPASLAAQLRSLGDAIDTAAPPVAADDVESPVVHLSPDARLRRPRRRAAWTVAAGVAAATVGLVAWQVQDTSTPQMLEFGDPIDSDGDPSVPDSASPTTDTAPSTTSPDGEDEALGTLTLDDTWTAIAERVSDVLLIVDRQTGVATMLSTDGSILGEVGYDGLQAVRPEQPVDIEVFTGIVRPQASLTDVPEDCRFADHAAGVRVAGCGASAETTDLDRVTPRGERRTIAHPAPLPAGSNDEAAGQWTTARVSPDGKWIGAQWSGECETRNAFLIDAVEGTFVSGDPARTAPDFDGIDESVFVGWLPDGRAAIHVFGSSCSSDAVDSLLAVDPASGDASALWAPGDGPRAEAITVVSARLSFQRFAQADLLIDALDHAVEVAAAGGDGPIELLGGDHPGPGVADQVVAWRGGEAAVVLRAAEPTNPQRAPSTTSPDRRTRDQLDGYAVDRVTRADGSTAIELRCGANMLTVADLGVRAELSAADLDDLTRLIVPGLGCTVRPLEG